MAGKTAKEFFQMKKNRWFVAGIEDGITVFAAVSGASSGGERRRVPSR
jgi:hypothetical protein